MTWQWSGVVPRLSLVALIALAGCGNRYLVTRPATTTSSMHIMDRAPIGPATLVAPPAFGDADPVEWSGTTPAAYPVHGVDVSRWQGDVDWAKARDNGVSFAFIKATEGGDHTDPAFRDNWLEAGLTGVPRGAYHFYYFCRSAAEQARWFIANVPKERGALPPVLDLEWNAASRNCPQRPGPAAVQAEVLTFLNIVGAHYGQQPIVYTTVDFWKDNELWRLDGAQPWFRAVSQHPSEAFPGATWSFWQYSGTGLVPGVGGPVDVNAFAGSREAWAAWLGAHSL